MRRGFLYFTALCAGVFLFIIAAQGQVLVSKIQTAGTTVTDEWVELYNASGATTSLAGWSLKKMTASGAQSNLVSSFGSAIAINPFSYLLVAHADYQAGSTTADVGYSNSSASLADNNAVLLYNAAATLIDAVFWGSISSTPGSPAQNPSAGQRLARKPNTGTGNGTDTGDSSTDFTLATDAPFNSASPARGEAGAEEVTSTVETASAGTPLWLWPFITINEFVSDPESGPEWVELFNSATTSVDLSGAKLCDNRSGECTIASATGTIAAGSWATLYLSSARLNNDGDSVILKDPNGAVLDSVAYGTASLPAPSKGQAAARTVDGAGEWTITTQPTAARANTIVAPPIPDPPSPTPTPGGGFSGLTTAPSGNSDTTARPTTSTTSRPTPPTVRETTTIIFKTSAPTVLSPHEPAVFSAARSADPRGGRISFLWHFGDGTASAGAEVVHQFASSGLYTVILTAASTQGTHGTTTFALSVGPQFLPRTGELRLNEILPNPVGGEENEFVELASFGSTTTILSGWKIKTGSGKTFTIPDNTLLTPNDTLVFHRSATGLAFNNKEDSVVLISPNNTVVDTVSWADSPAGQSYVRFGDGWVWTAAITPGELAPVLLSSTSSPRAPTRTRVATIGVVAPPRTAGLARVRELPRGTRAGATGTVVALPGVFGSQYFYITDGESGLLIYSYAKQFPPLKLGDTVRVSGTLSRATYGPRLNVSRLADIDVLATGPTPKPHETLVSEVSPDVAGTLVSVEGEITEIKSTTIYVDDGEAEIVVYLKKGAGIDKNALAEGAVVRVTGIVENGKTGVELWPRSEADIEILAAPKPATPPGAKPANGLFFLVGVAVAALPAVVLWRLKNKNPLPGTK